MDQAERGKRFEELHRGRPFVIPNPWDAGSARVLEALGFEALATSQQRASPSPSAGPTATPALDEVVAHVAALTEATELPVSVDLENGYGAAPEQAARAIEAVAAVGAVGGSIEDFDPERAALRAGRGDRADRRGGRGGGAAAVPLHCSPRGPRTTSAATPTSTTRSPACRPTKRPAPTSSTRPGCATPSEIARRRARRPSGR